MRKTIWRQVGIPYPVHFCGNFLWNYSHFKKRSLVITGLPKGATTQVNAFTCMYLLLGATDAGLDWGRVYIPTPVQTHRKPCVHPRILTGTWWSHVQDSRCQRASVKIHADWNEEQNQTFSYNVHVLQCRARFLCPTSYFPFSLNNSWVPGLVLAGQSPYSHDLNARSSVSLTLGLIAQDHFLQQIFANYLYECSLSLCLSLLGLPVHWQGRLVFQTGAEFTL